MFILLPVAATADTPAVDAFGKECAYPNGEITDSRVEPPYLEIVTPDDMKTVYEYYKNTLPPAGWAMKLDFPNPPDNYQLQFTRDGKTASIGIGRMNNGDSVARLMLQ